jgi:alpha-tubulin suppressor-like RCC1 family protein
MRTMVWSVLVFPLCACGLFGADFSDPAAAPGASRSDAAVASELDPNTPPVEPGANGCGEGTKLCNGLCVPMSAPKYGCAAETCAPCSLSGGYATCKSGACGVESCMGSGADCDGTFANGCEVNTLTSATNCGACGTVCGTSQVCSKGACKSSCDIGTTKCGASCVDTKTDQANCGTCGNTCPAPTNGSATCGTGTCSTSCNTGYSACASGCCANPPPTPAIQRDRLALSATHSCAVTPSGTVKCWGDNSYGQLGNGATGTTVNLVSPAMVQGLTGVRSVSASGWHSCALTTSGTVFCWGLNNQGQLGNNYNYPRDNPLPVDVGLTGIVSIAAGRSHTCAVTSAGTVKCWGSNSSGESGQANTGPLGYLIPVDVAGVTGAVSIRAGYESTCARLNTGAVTCWGANLGDTSSVRTAPATVPGLSNVVSLSVGESHSCAALSGGAVKCWGKNTNGQLGDGSTASHATPLPAAVAGVTAIAAGGRHSCGVTTTGALMCWGADYVSNASNHPTPHDAGVSDAVEVSAGPNGTCFFSSTGLLRCWDYRTSITIVPF